MVKENTQKELPENLVTLVPPEKQEGGQTAAPAAPSPTFVSEQATTQKIEDANTKDPLVSAIVIGITKSGLIRYERHQIMPFHALGLISAAEFHFRREALLDNKGQESKNKP